MASLDDGVVFVQGPLAADNRRAGDAAVADQRQLLATGIRLRYKKHYAHVQVSSAPSARLLTLVRRDTKQSLHTFKCEQD